MYMHVYSRKSAIHGDGVKKPAGTFFPPEPVDYRHWPVPDLSHGLPRRVQFTGATERLDVSAASAEGDRDVGVADSRPADLWDVWRSSSLREIQEQLCRYQVLPEKYVLDDHQFELIRSICLDPQIMDNLALIWMQERAVIKLTLQN